MRKQQEHMGKEQVWYDNADIYANACIHCIIGCTCTGLEAACH